MDLNEHITGTYKLSLVGIPASSGIVIAKSHILKTEVFYNTQKFIEPSEIEKEIGKFINAQQLLIDELNETLEKVPKNALDLIGILQADLMILQDPIFSDEIINFIKNKFSVESAIVKQFETNKGFLRRSNDEIFKERIVELDNIEKKFIQILTQKEKILDIPEHSIIIAQSLSPSDLVKLLEKKIVGFILESGGITSHISILARSYNLPAIVSTNYAARLINNNENIILDAYSGKIFVNPDIDLLKFYQEKINQIRTYKEKLGEIIDLPAVTKDGKEITLWGNVNTFDDVKQAILDGAKGLGLVRTESLVIEKGRFPSENEQYEFYKKICETVFPLIVTLRAFDVGSDKYTDELILKESNPALGFRGIRFLISRPEIFKNQIRAILRSSKFKNVRFMLPMITSVDEVMKTKNLIEECKAELAAKGYSYDDNMPMGVMIETPAAALISDELSRIVDFFSIGTNDLTQYVLAADRTNELLSEFFNNFHPGILRLIDFTISAAHKNKIPVAVCGEMAGHPLATELLVGMDVDELSMAPSLLLEIKNKILSLDYKTTRQYVMRTIKSNVVRDIFQNVDSNSF